MNTQRILTKNPDRKIAVLTCYDFPSARALDTSDIDIVFVGDSVGTNMLGYRSELEVTLEDMVHHLKAVRKGITRKLLMVDLPYQTYSTPEDGLRHAQLMRTKGADIVKLEGGSEIAPVVSAIVADAMQVMGHLGFQPQIAGGAKRAVAGALSEEATRIYEDAVCLEQSGVCAIVLECVPEDVAKVVSERLTVPTIGIGSGKYTDGQVLVIADVVGWYNMPYRFVRRYDQFFERTVQAANHFCEEIRSGEYPQRNNGFRIKAEQFQAFSDAIDKLPKFRLNANDSSTSKERGGRKGF